MEKLDTSVKKHGGVDSGESAVELVGSWDHLELLLKEALNSVQMNGIDVEGVEEVA